MTAEQIDIDSLNNEFSLEIAGNNLHFIDGEGDIPVVEIQNPLATARISLQGAHVLSWVPAGEDEVIWLSKQASFAPGKSVRGGIPICWPWFGAHESEPSFPAHGFARTTLWQVLSSEALEDNSTRITFRLPPKAEHEAMRPADTDLQLQITVGKKLELALITSNDGNTAITIGQALHTYFNIGDIGDTYLHGLDDTDYLDKPDNFKRKHQHGPISVEQEVDRIYLDTASDCVIDDNNLKRNIIIIKCGSHSTVVWNPWREVADNMGDLGEDGYRRMLCVESANAADDVVTIEAGKKHHLWVQYEVQKH